MAHSSYPLFFCIHDYLPARLNSAIRNHKKLFFKYVNNMIKKWTGAINLEENYGAHTLRKTQGYIHRTKYGIGFEVVCKWFNRSSPAVTTWKFHTRQIKQLLAGISKQIKLQIFLRDGIIFRTTVRFFEYPHDFWIVVGENSYSGGSEMLIITLFWLCRNSPSWTNIATGSRSIEGCMNDKQLKALICGFEINHRYSKLSWSIWFNMIGRWGSTRMDNMISYFFKSFSKWE